MSSRRLFVVTGPSHAGKTTIIEHARRTLAAPTAVIAIDDIMARLDVGPEALWPRGLPAAYDVAAASVEALLEHDFVVFVESTFTFVPRVGREPVRHPEQLERLRGVASRAGAPTHLVHVTASLDALRARQRESGRLEARIVEETWSLHQAWGLDDPIVVEADTVGPEQAASIALAALGLPTRADG